MRFENILFVIELFEKFVVKYVCQNVSIVKNKNKIFV
jgi:hypothetical protein